MRTIYPFIKTKLLKITLIFIKQLEIGIILNQIISLLNMKLIIWKKFNYRQDVTCMQKILNRKNYFKMMHTLDCNNDK